jgi:hypothetical protein
MDFPYWTTGAGIEVVSSRNVEVYANTVEENAQGITGADDHRGTGIHGPWTVINLYVHDNAIVSTSLGLGFGRTGLLDTAGTAAFSASSNNRFEDNSYVLGQNSDYFLWMGSDLNESEWQAFGLDTGGTFQH